MGLRSQSTPKVVVGVTAILIFIAFAITQLVFITIDHTPLPPPAAAEEAISNFTSPRFKNMDAPQQDAYIAQAALLVDELTGDKRREIFRKYLISDEQRSLMIKTIALKEFQKAVDYDKASTDQEKQRLVEAQTDKILARFSSLPPEFRANYPLIQSPQTQPSDTNAPLPLAQGTPPSHPLPGMPGGGWFSRIRNYTRESPEFQTPENLRITQNFQNAVNIRLKERIATQ